MRNEFVKIYYFLSKDTKEVLFHKRSCLYFRILVRGLTKVKSKTFSMATSWLDDNVRFMGLLTFTLFWFSFDPVTSYSMTQSWNVTSMWNFSEVFMLVTTLKLLWTTLTTGFACFKILDINCAYDNFIHLMKMYEISFYIVTASKNGNKRPHFCYFRN